MRSLTSCNDSHRQRPESKEAAQFGTVHTHKADWVRERWGSFSVDEMVREGSPGLI